MTFNLFKAAVEAAGLTSRECRSDHWQIVDGQYLVNVWPFTKTGFRFAPHGAGVRNGNVEQAIAAAGGAISESEKNERQSRNRAKKTKKRLMTANPHCHYCGTRLGNDTARLDHKIPLSKGGTNEDTNLVLACTKCDTEKSNKMPAEFTPTATAEAVTIDPPQEFAVGELAYYDAEHIGRIESADCHDGKWSYRVDYFNQNQRIGEMPEGGNGPVWREG